MKLNNNILFLFIGLSIGTLGTNIAYFYISKHSTENIYNDWKLKEKELTLQIDSLNKVNKDLKEKVISEDSTLTKIEIDYEKNCSILYNQPFDVQHEFFTNYLESHRFYGGYNNNSAQGN